MNARHAILAVAAVAIVLPLLGNAQGRRGQPAAPTKAKVSTANVVRDSSGNVVFNREVYAYPRSGRRDPFASLIASGDIRPLLADLEVVGIIFDPAGRSSVATLKDVSSNEIYRVRVGSVFGRMRVSAIRQREVALAIDEFGFTRQEVLSITVPTRGGRTP
ncbi:MAG: hypothetical protein KF709_04080 [Gemmatimonadaceae bacterium]|nr:hypothetical protein [Gemmatimonadaceae bacterium]